MLLSRNISATFGGFILHFHGQLRFVLLHYAALTLVFHSHDHLHALLQALLQALSRALTSTLRRCTSDFETIHQNARHFFWVFEALLTVYMSVIKKG